MYFFILFYVITFTWIGINLTDKAIRLDVSIDIVPTIGDSVLMDMNEVLIVRVVRLAWSPYCHVEGHR